MKRLLACMLLLLCLFMLVAAHAEETSAYQPLQYGDRGDAVVVIQERLKELGYIRQDQELDRRQLDAFMAFDLIPAI